jgi:hypothetical protein
MKNALDSFLGGKSAEDVGTASPAPYENDMMLASEDDMGGEEEAGGLMNEVQGMLAGATPEQLQQVKDILSGGKGPSESAPPMPESGGPDMGMPM